MGLPCGFTVGWTNRIIERGYAIHVESKRHRLGRWLSGRSACCTNVRTVVCIINIGINSRWTWWLSGNSYGGGRDRGTLEQGNWLARIAESWNSGLTALSRHIKWSSPEEETWCQTLTSTCMNTHSLTPLHTWHLPSQEPMHTCKKISGKENKKDFEVSSVIQREKENKTQSLVLKRNHLKFKFVTDCIPIPSTYVGNWISKIFYTVCSANLQKKMHRVDHSVSGMGVVST